MYHTGCDAHKTTCSLQFIDDDGALGLSKNVPATPEALSKFLGRLDGPTTVTLEASGSYWWLHQFFVAHPKVNQVNVVDPRRSRKLSEELSVRSGYGRAKNDRIDAEMLAEQNRRGLAPTIHVPTLEQLTARSLNRHRWVLVRQRTMAINRIHGLLRLHGVNISFRELRDLAASRERVFRAVPAYVEILIRNFMQQIELLQRQVKLCDDKLDEVLPLTHPRLQLLMTAPGIGPVLARTIYTEILDIKHVRAPKYLISYAGLAPLENKSAGQQGSVKLNRHCNYYLKYAFIEAGHEARRHRRYQKKYDHDAKKHGKQIAKFNLARRLAKAVYWMLTRQQPFTG